MPRRTDSEGAGRTIALGWSESPDTDPPPTASAPSAGRALSAGGAPSGEGGPRAERRRSLVLGGAIVLVLALVLVLPPVLLGGAGAERAVEQYLDAVVAGDAETVREHAVPVDEALDIALTDGVLQGARDRVSGYTIDEMRVDGDSAVADVTLTGGDRELESTLSLERRRDGLLRRPVWELQPVNLPVVRLNVPAGSAQLEVNGQMLEIPARSRPQEQFAFGEITLQVLPGTYEVRAPQSGDLFAPRTAEVSAPPVLGLWNSALVPVSSALTDAGVQEAIAQLRSSLRDCARSRSPAPSDCPIIAPPEVTERGVWTITSTPEFELVEDMEGYSIFRARVSAEFAVPGAEGDEEEVHEVEADVPAVAVADRDGVLHAHWYSPATVEEE
ncbi:hypothetical protein ACT3SP_09025 [Brachybacterium sp. AOP43-C2-M15]|uniref:hypothetical protein n=1 Tax=Brachybacterium sp. AOP43-C2-M15 TaxID=3457661 RepID=UPI004033C016